MRVVAGESYTLMALFCDGDGVPINLTDPQIVIFWYPEGDRVDLVDEFLPDPEETGRYTFRYPIPEDIPDGSILYLEISGTEGAATRRDQQMLEVAMPNLSGLAVQTV